MPGHPALGLQRSYRTASYGTASRRYQFRNVHLQGLRAPPGRGLAPAVSSSTSASCDGPAMQPAI